MRILMVGAGATGGFYGGLLAKAGRDVTFLLRERRAAQVRATGLELQLHTGELLTLHPPVLTAAELREAPQAFDLILISTKSFQLAGAMDDIAAAVGPTTLILPFLNGMAHLQQLQRRFGAQHVLGGLVRVVSDLRPDGRIVQMDSLDELSFGVLPEGAHIAIEAVNDALQGAGFTAILRPDMLASMWQKWWILASMGTICILADGTVGEAARAPHGSEMNLAAMAECTAIAAAYGYPPDPAMVAEHTERITKRDSTMTTSLYRDLRKGGAMEADQVLGDLIGHAQEKKIAVPLLTAAYVRLKVQEAKRAQSPQ